MTDRCRGFKVCAFRVQSAWSRLHTPERPCRVTLLVCRKDFMKYSLVCGIESKMRNFCIVFMCFIIEAANWSVWYEGLLVKILIQASDAGFTILTSHFAHYFVHTGQKWYKRMDVFIWIVASNVLLVLNFARALTASMKFWMYKCINLIRTLNWKRGWILFWGPGIETKKN